MPAVTVNGKLVSLPNGATVRDAVEASGATADGRGVAAAVDGEVVPRRDWADTPLDDGREVEVLHAVQGG
jgi:sulfur carrier protein